MKLRSLSLILTIFVAGFAGTTSRTLAQNSVSTAAERCALSQGYLKGILKTRDLHARVDSLQAYQYIYHRIDVFARRLERNNQSGATEMRASLVKLNSMVDTFKIDYERYDQAREAVSSLPDCRANLAQFQGKLADARNKREAVSANVATIEQILKTEIAAQLELIHTSFMEGS